MLKEAHPYTVRIASLKAGNHTYNWKCDNSFFALFPYTLIKNGDFNSEINVFKEAQRLVFDVRMAGNVALTCDRCLQDRNQPFSVIDQLIVQMKGDLKTIEEKDDNLWWVPLETPELDLSTYIYELVSLQKPLRFTCEDINENCDPIILARINQQNTTDQSDTEAITTDPRWEALKKLKQN